MYNLVRSSTEFGLSVEDVSIDWPAVIARKDRIVRRLEAGKQASLEQRGVAVFRQHATFVSPHEVNLDGQRLHAGKIVLATGSHPVRPPIPGLDLAITSDEALNLRDLPASLAIIGGGVVALEFAHIWSSTGVHVTILERGERILAREDREIAEALAALSRARGIEIHTGAEVQRVERTGGGYAVTAQTPAGEQRFTAELIMLAAGRSANVAGLGLDAAGVEVADRGIAVNSHLQTTAPHVYAGGDATGRHYLTPVAAYEGRLAARNALQGNVEEAGYSLVTHTIFTLPPASSVGLTEQQAHAQGFDVTVTRLPFADISRAVIDDEIEGFVKIVEDRGSERLLGVHILGAHAEEMIHQFAIAMKAHLTRRDFAQLIAIHPSFSEGLIGAVVSAEAGSAASRCQ